jgi:site-specific recombinase XerD
LTRFSSCSILKQGTYAYDIRAAKSSPSLLPVIAATKKLRRQYHLTYDQTHYVAKEVCRALAIERPKSRKRVVARLSREEERKLTAADAEIAKRVYPHLLRYSVATTLLERGMPSEQIQKFLGYSKLETMQIHAESSAAMIKDSYQRALAGRTGARVRRGPWS